MIKVIKTIQDNNAIKILFITIIVLLIIGAGSSILVNYSKSAKNLDKLNTLITSMVEGVSKDQYLMDQEQIKILEIIKSDQYIYYKNKDIDGLLSLKGKLKEFKDSYPGIIIAFAKTDLSSMELPEGASMEEKDKLLKIMSEVEKSIVDSSVSLVSKVELIRDGIKQGNDIILGVTNRILEESKKKDLVNNPKTSKAQLNISVIKQRPELPTGCEATSLAMLLNYIGSPITKIQVVQDMPYHSSNPNLGFVGSPYESSGYTIYPPALMDIMEKYAGSSLNLTGKGTSSIKNSIDSGKPVIVWGKLTGFNLHCVLVTGYNKDGFYYNDPWTGEKNRYISNKAFETAWKAIGYRAMSY